MTQSRTRRVRAATIAVWTFSACFSAAQAQAPVGYQPNILEWCTGEPGTFDVRIKCATILPKGSNVRATVYFGEQVVGEGAVAIATEGVLTGGIQGLSAKCPPGEYLLHLQSRLQDQDSALSQAWVQKAGLSTVIEARFPFVLGAPEEESAARKSEQDAWAEWLDQARKILEQADIALGESATGDPHDACQALAGGLEDLGGAMPQPFVFSYFRGARERAGSWIAMAGSVGPVCEKSWSEKQELPKDRRFRLERSRKTLAEFSAFVGGGAGALARKSGGVYLHPKLRFELRCARPGWSWIEREEGERCLSLEQPTQPWSELSIDAWARPGGKPEELQTFLQDLLGRFAGARVSIEEPSQPAEAAGIKATRGSKFTLGPGGATAGWIRVFLSADGRMLGLSATAPAARWSRLQPVANEVFSTLAFRATE